MDRDSLIDGVKAVANALGNYLETDAEHSLEVIEAAYLRGLEETRAELKRVREAKEKVAQKKPRVPRRVPGPRGRFFACVEAMGLPNDKKSKPAQYAALTDLLGRTITSRREMNEQEWDKAATAVELGELSWTA